MKVGDDMSIKVKELKIEGINKEVQRCFGGAWYHKVMSVSHNFYGIEGTITLPMPFIKRYKDDYQSSKMIDYDHKNLDVSSVYMGGHAIDESDVGLCLTTALLDGKITKGSCVYRPFWRYITDENLDIGTYDFDKNRFYAATQLSDIGGLKNIYAMHHISFSETYFMPGDKIKMSLISPKADFLQMTIELIEISKLKYAVDLRKKYKLKDPQTFVSPMFSSKGHGTDVAKTYKRVNAIDQVSNEGKVAINSKTTIYNGNWHSCYLYHKVGNDIFKTPFNESISVSMNCPDRKGFIISPLDPKTGGQNVTIIPKDAKS